MSEALFDENAFAAFAADEFGPGVRLSRLGNVPRKTVFKMTGAKGVDGPVFVKCAPPDDCRRAWLALSSAKLPFLPRPLRLAEWRGTGVIFTEWIDGETVKPEDMTAAQTENLLRAHDLVLDAMRSVPRTACLPPPPVKEQFDAVLEFSRRHPLARPFLRGITGIPAGLRTYDESALVPIVNDFHCSNYAFDGDRVTAVYDFDRVSLGSPAEDLTYAIVRRLRKASLGQKKKRRAVECYRRMVSLSRSTREECARAVNIFRIAFAAKRVASRPGNPLVALDIFRHDRELARLADWCLANLL